VQELEQVQVQVQVQVLVSERKHATRFVTPPAT
jgi:hypothetical protein